MSTKIGTKRPDVAIRNKSKEQSDKMIASWKNEEVRKKRMESMKKNQSRKPSYGHTGKKHTEDVKQIIRKKIKGIFSGNKHWNWKGGITKINRLIRNSFKYRQWRSDVFTRDNFTCQECGKRGGRLEAHHIKEFSKIIQEYNIKTIEDSENCEELWNINNGQTLCSNCHNKTKNGNNKKLAFRLA